MYWKFPMMLQHSESNRLFNTHSIVQQADLLILEDNKKATLKINMPY